MRIHRWIVGIALMVVAVNTPAHPQRSSSAAKPTPLPVKIQVVFTKGEGDKKVSSPYAFFLSSSGVAASLRVGTEVIVGTIPEQLGTQIDATVTPADEGRFNVNLNFTGRFPSSEGKPHDFAAQNTFTLRDGESTKYTGTDDSGAAFTLDVTLTVVK
jgi:hypothetical protein